MPIPPAGHSGRDAPRVVPNALSRATKKPGGLAAQPGHGRKALAVSRYVFSAAWIACVRRSPCSGANAGTAAPWLGAAGLRYDLFNIPVIASLVIVHVHRISPAHAAPAQKQKTRSARAVRVFDERRSAYSRSLPSSGRTRSSPLRGRCPPRIGRFPECTTAYALGACASHSNRIVASNFTLFRCKSIQ